MPSSFQPPQASYRESNLSSLSAEGPQDGMPIPSPERTTTRARAPPSGGAEGSALLDGSYAVSHFQHGQAGAHQVIGGFGDGHEALDEAGR